MHKKYPVTEGDLVRMNVGQSFWGAKLEAIKDSCTYKAAVQTWLSKMPEMLKEGVGMLLHGENRKGKTSAAVICMKAAATHGGTAYLIRADAVAGATVEREMFDEYKTVIQRCRTVDLLVIDELVHRAGRDQSTAMLEQLIRWRYDRKLSMIFTANTGLKGVEERYGVGLAMVVRSRCLPVEVTGTEWYDEEKRKVNDMFDRKVGE